MNHRHARSQPEIAREEPSINVTLTDHQAFVARHMTSLRILELAEGLAEQVKSDGYTISGEQVALRIALMDLMHLNEEFS